jgi:hypothetical protein
LLYSNGLNSVRGLVETAIFTLIRTFMGGFVISIAFGSFIFVGSKDLLWVYKKSPRNVSGLIYSFFIMLIILGVIMDLGLTIAFTIILKLDFINALISFVAFLFSAILAIIIAIGVQCFRPVFEEKGKNMNNNMFLIIIIQLGLFIGFVALISNSPQPFNSEWVIYEFLALYIGVLALIAIPIFFFGLKKLKRIE